MVTKKRGRTKTPGTCQAEGCGATWLARYPEAKYCESCRLKVWAQANKNRRNEQRNLRRAELRA